LLRVDRVSSYYGPLQALHEASLEVPDAGAVAVLGPNGAGKSTLLHSISGLIHARFGSITYNGHEIAHEQPHHIVRMGIVQVPEGRRIFTQMTVHENLMMGAFTRDGGKEVTEDVGFVFSLFPDLAEKRSRLGGELSGGQQQMLAIGRALMAKPSLLLLDEPSLGLSPILVEQLGQAITDIRRRLGMAILLVEQNVGLALEMASHVYVMATGRVVLSAASSEISVDDIRRSYLGQSHAAPR
jgi:branched-chain amino acid transport system ATP-binding protein